MSSLMQLTDFDALSFDCYGTLIDWEAGITAVLGPWASAHGVRRKQRGTARAICADRGSSGGGASHSAVSGHPRCRDAQSGVELGSRRQLGRRRAARHLGGGLAGLPRFAGCAACALATVQARHPVQRRPRIVREEQRAGWASSSTRSSPRRTSARTNHHSTISRCWWNGSAQWVSKTAACCMSLRACSTIMFRPEALGCRRCGSTVEERVMGGARRHRRPRRRRLTGPSRPWPYLRPLVIRSVTSEGCRLSPASPVDVALLLGLSRSRGQDQRQFSG